MWKIAISNKRKVKKNLGLSNLKLCFEQSCLEYCGSLKENVPHRFISLNICFLTDGTLWEILVVHPCWRSSVTRNGFQIFNTIPTELSFPPAVNQHMSSQMLLQLPRLLYLCFTLKDSSPLKSYFQLNTLFYKLPWSGYFVIVIE